MSGYHVTGLTIEGSEIEKDFEGKGALRAACLFAQGIEENGGSCASVSDEDGNEVDFWDGYQVAITPDGRLALGAKLTGATQ